MKPLTTKFTSYFVQTLVLFILLSPTQLWASHIAGSDLTYTCTTNPNIYQVTLKLYRDCQGIQLCANCPTSLSPSCGVSLTIKGANLPAGSGIGSNPCAGTSFGTQALTIVTSLSGFDVVQLCATAKSVCSNCGTRTPGSYTPGVEVYTFTGTINLSSLPSSCCLVSIGFATCCRNPNITTLANPTSLNFYTEAFINRCLSSCNSSPIFKNSPVVSMCAGKDFTYNLGAEDPDGDSLSYIFGTSLIDAGVSAPYVSPYSTTVPFPYLGAPMQSPPAVLPAGIYFNKVNGDIQFRPMGAFVSNLVVQINQWRTLAGIPTLVGMTRRDMQIYSQFCSANDAPRFRTYDSTGIMHVDTAKYSFNVKPGKRLCFILAARDDGGASDTTEISVILPDTLTATGATVTKLYNPSSRAINGPKYDSVRFCWTAPAGFIPRFPQYLVVQASDNACPISGKLVKSISITVVDNIIYTPNGQSVCAGDSLPLYITFQQGLTYQWLLNGSPIPGAINNDFYARNAGIYQVVKYLANIPQDTTDGVAIIINTATQAALTPSGSASFCYGGETTLSGNSGSGLTYKWLKNGTLLNGQNNQTLMVNSTGNYRMVLTNSSGCRDTSSTVSVNGFQKKFVALMPIGSTTICNGDSTGLQTQAGINWKLKWFKDGIFLGDTISLLKYFKQTGSYKVTMKDSLGCLDTSAAVSIVVNTNPFAQLTPTPSVSVCPGSSVLLSANTGTGLTYQWYLEGNLISGSSGSATFNASLQGNYRVRVIHLTTGCFTNSNSTQLNHHPTPNAILSNQGAVNFCEGDSVILEGNSGNGLTYEWLKDTIVISGKTAIQLMVNTSGQYRVRVSNTEGCKTLSNAINVTVNPKPIPNPILGPQAGLMVGNNYDYYIANPSAHSVFWYAVNGSLLTAQGRDSITVRWDSIGTVSLWTLLTSSSNCRDSVGLQLSVLSSGLPSVIRSGEFTLQPNPVKNELTLGIPSGSFSGVTVRVMDALGKLVYESFDGNGNTSLQVPVQTLPPGIYTLLVRTGNSEGTLRFQKE